MSLIKKILLTAALLLFTELNAQVTYGHALSVKADAGVSNLRWAGREIPEPYIVNSQRSLFCFSWRAGVSYNHRFKGASGLGVDVLYSAIAGKQIAIWQDVGPLGTFTYNCTEQLPYISIPFYYTFHRKKLSVSVGGDYMRYLSGNVRASFTQLNGGVSTTSYISPDPSIVLPADLGLYGAIGYRFHKRFSTVINFYYSWLNIVRNVPTFSPGQLRIVQLTGGLSYYFYLKEPPKEKATSVRDD